MSRRYLKVLLLIAICGATQCVEKASDTTKPTSLQIHVYLYRPIAKEGEWPPDLLALAQPTAPNLAGADTSLLFFPVLHIHRMDLTAATDAKLGDTDADHTYRELVNRYQTAGLKGQIRSFYGKTPDLHDLQELARNEVTRNTPPALLSDPTLADAPPASANNPTPRFAIRPAAENESADAPNNHFAHVFATSEAAIIAIANDAADHLRKTPNAADLTYAIAYEPPANHPTGNTAPSESTITATATSQDTSTSPEPQQERPNHPPVEPREKPPAQPRIVEPTASVPCDQQMVEVAPGSFAPKNMCPPGYTGPDRDCKCWPDEKHP
jgi:hypothetical protein